MWRRRSLKRRGPEYGHSTRAAETHARARVAIAAALSGAEPTAAWDAVWELAQTADTSAKDDVLDMLRDYVDSAVASRGATREATSYFGSMRDTAIGVVDHQWHKIELACDFGQAIQRSMQPADRLVPASNEVRAMQKRDEIAAYEERLHKMGVPPGEGLPMWLMYMSRRSKRAWR